MREIVYRLDVGHNFLKIDASENFYLRPNGDDTQKVFMLPQSYTINCRRLLLRESSLNPQWFLDLLFYVADSDTRKDSEILDEFFKFSSYDVAFDSDNVSSSGQNVFVSGVNGDAPFFQSLLESISNVRGSVDSVRSELIALQTEPLLSTGYHNFYTIGKMIKDEINYNRFYNTSFTHEIRASDYYFDSWIKQNSITHDILQSYNTYKYKVKTSMNLIGNNIYYGLDNVSQINLHIMSMAPSKILMYLEQYSTSYHNFVKPWVLVLGRIERVNTTSLEDKIGKIVMCAVIPDCKMSSLWIKNESGEKVLYINDGYYFGCEYSSGGNYHLSGTVEFGTN